MPDTAIDYGAHAPAEPIDYGAHAPASLKQPESKGIGDYASSFLTGLVPDTAKGIYHTVLSAFPDVNLGDEDSQKTKDLIDKGDYWGAAKHVVAKAVEGTPGGKIITGTIHNAIDETQNAAEAYQKGDTATAANHLSRAVPIIGPMIGGLADVGAGTPEERDAQGNITKPAVEGDPARMLGQIAGMAVAPKVISEAVPAAVEAAPKAAAVVKGAAQGAKEGAVSTVPVPSYGYAGRAAKALGIEKIPAVIPSALVGKYGSGALLGPFIGPAAADIGEVVGAATPVVRGAYLRAKQALADYNAAQMPKAPEEGPPLSPGGIPTGPDLSGGGSVADQLAAELARRRAANAPTHASAASPEPATPAPPPDPFEPTKADLDQASQGFGAKDFDAFYKKYPQAAQRLRDVIYKSNAQRAAAAAPPPEVSPEAPPAAQQPEVAPQENVPSPVAPEAAAAVAEVAPEPAPTEPINTPEPEAERPAAAEAQQAPVYEPAAPVQPEVAPVENPVSGQDLAHPIPKNFGPNAASDDMPILPGHVRIASDTVHSVGYDPETGHPEIHFKKPLPNGGLYRYPNLPPEELQKAVRDVPSFGAWVRETLRTNPEWHAGYKKVSVPQNPPLLEGTPYGNVPKQETVGTPSPAENTPPIAAQPAENPATGKVVSVPTNQISVDPNRFQFKANVGQGGAGEELRSVSQYDPEKAGVQAIWKDPANGKTYIVNGHNRLALAQRTGTPEINAMYLDAKDAAEARTKGALINIAEGRGTAIDAAKVFRDSQLGPEELQKEGISPTGAVAKTGVALANLDPALFSKVVSGEIPIERASIIGEGVPNPADQKALYDLIRKREASGKSVTNAQIGEMIRFTHEAPTVSETQDSLFGSHEMTRSLIPEKAEVSAYIRQQLSQEKKLFQAVANGSAAEKLGTAGNIIKTEENAKTALTTAQAQAIYDKLSTSAGPINDALDEAAQAIAKGNNATSAKTIAYQKIKSELFKQAKSLAGASETSP